MSLNELVSKYISSAEHVFSNMEAAQTPMTLDLLRVRNVMDFAKAYLRDAEYYREKKKFEVSLTSIAYCEGLLDALRLLGVVRFEWPNKKRENKTKRRVVLASGVFDLLHLGHVRFLEEAKKAGGLNAELIVIVARDSTAKKRKGTRPIVPESQRCALVASLKVVDKAILGYEDFNMNKVIEKIKPDIIALGYDSHTSSLEQTVRELMKEKRLKIRVVKVGHFREDELDSSSKIKQKIIEDYGR